MSATAAFRGRSLDFLGGDGVVVAAEAVTGIDFWASPSDMSTLAVSCCSFVAEGKGEGEGENGACGVALSCGGGRVSLTLGIAALAMELSGMPVLRGCGGGTGNESNDGGR